MSKKCFTILRRSGILTSVMFEEAAEVSKSRFNGIDPKEIQEYMINAISSAMNLKFRLECDEEYTEEVELVREQMANCYRTLAIVQNAIEIERYNSADIKPRAFDMTAAVEDIVALVRSMTRDYEIKLEWNIDKGVVCVADPERFAVCLMNLIVNAYQVVSIETGVVNVTLKRYRDYAAVTVSDDGSDRSKQQVEDCIANAVNGGFAVMKRFCESVGTRHVVVARENGGLGISIRIPLKTDDEGILSLKSGESPPRMETFSPATLLIYKLPKAIVK